MDNVERIARESIEDFNRLAWQGNFQVDDESRAFWADEPVIVPMRAALEQIEYQGPSAVDDFVAASAEAWERLRVDPSQIRRLDDHSALIYGDLTAVARGTGIETRAKVVLHMVLDGGRISRMQTFMSEAEALKAVAP